MHLHRIALALAFVATGHPLLAANLTVTPATHDFGTVTQGQRKIVTIRVANDGVVAKTVPVRSSSPVFTISDTSLAIPGRKSVSLIVGVAESAPPGAQSATITIDDGRDAIRLDVRAKIALSTPPTAVPTRAGTPGVTVNPAALDFGALELDQAKTLTFNVTSPAATPCSVLPGFANLDSFSASTTSLTLSAGQPAPVSVTFKATARLRLAPPGNAQGTFLVTCGFSKVTVDVKGRLLTPEKVSIAVKTKGSVITGTTSDTRNGTILNCQNNGGTCSNATLQPGVRLDLKAACSAPTEKVRWAEGTGSAVLCNGTASPTCSFVINGNSAITAECAK